MTDKTEEINRKEETELRRLRVALDGCGMGGGGGLAWARYRDYARIHAVEIIEQLEFDLSRQQSIIDRLRAEVEELRKALLALRPSAVPTT